MALHPTDLDHFLTVCRVVSILQQLETHVSRSSWQTDDHHSQLDETLGLQDYIHRRSGPSFESNCAFAIACMLASEVTYSLHRRGPLTLKSYLLVVSIDNVNPSVHKPIED